MSHHLRFDGGDHLKLGVEVRAVKPFQPARCLDGGSIKIGRIVKADIVYVMQRADDIVECKGFRQLPAKFNGAGISFQLAADVQLDLGPVALLQLSAGGNVFLETAVHFSGIQALPDFFRIQKSVR